MSKEKEAIKKRARGMLSVSGDLHQKLKIIAVEAGRSISELADEIVAEYLKNKKGDKKNDQV
jgi:hypothetical protein